MVAQCILTQAGVVTLLMTSSPLLLLMLSPTLLHAQRASSLSSEPRCKFPRFLQTRRNKQWMMNQSNAFATFDVNGGKIFARYGACIRSRDQSRLRQSGMAECKKLNYTRVCLEKRPGNKYLVRHVESDFDDKYVCLEFLKRGISVVQVKMSLIQGEQFVAHLCDDRYMHVGPWPWVSEEHYRSDPVRCPFTGGYNLRLKYASPPPARRQSYYGSKPYYGPSYYARATTDSATQDCVDSTTAPIRMESDCVDGGGVVFNFKHQSCLPADTHVSLQQRALCMATWRSGRELFAMLRADNNDRAFFCLRVSLRQEEERDPRDMSMLSEIESMKIEEVMLFLGWVCPTSSYADSAGADSGTGNTVSPLSTPHMSLSVLDQQIITEPCTDQISLCHNHTSFCHHLHCMRTCGVCTPAAKTTRESVSSSYMSKKATVITSGRFSVRFAKHREGGVEHRESYAKHRENNGRNWESDSQQWEGSGLILAGEKADGESMNRETHAEHPDPHLYDPHTRYTPRKETYQSKCTFPKSIRGTWLRRTSDGNDEKIVIGDSTFNHPRLGLLECVTFSSTGSSTAPLQRVLWSRYTNGCYPRFTCLHFNTPAKSVMRFRVADMQLWPLDLSDDAICDQRHFMEPPDMYQPGDKYTMRSWEVVRRSGHIHKLACILPHDIPRVVSFIDSRGRSGCLVHGTYYSPRDLSLTFFPKSSRKGGNSRKIHAPTGHTKIHDVSVKTYDVQHRKSGHGRGNTHRKPGHKKHRLVPHTDDRNQAGNPKSFDKSVPRNHDKNHGNENSGSFDDHHHRDYDRKGVRFPDQHSVPPEHDEADHSKNQFKKENHHHHPNTYTDDFYPGERGGYDLDKTYLHTKNWTKGDYDLHPFNSYSKNTNSRRGPTYANKNNSDKRYKVSPHNDHHKSMDPQRMNNKRYHDNPHHPHHHPFNKRSKHSHRYQRNSYSDVSRYRRDSDNDVNNYNDVSRYRRNGDVNRYRRNSGYDVTNDSDVSRYRKDGDVSRYRRNRDYDVTNDNDISRYRRDSDVSRYSRSTDVRSRVQVSYQCLAVMTYVDSYKSLLTVTSGKPREVLCWLVVNASTLVVIKTSSCNTPTARHVLSGPAHSSLHAHHLHNILHLHQGERDCDAEFPANLARPEPIEFRDDEASGAVGCLLVGCGVLRVILVSFYGLTAVVLLLH